MLIGRKELKIPDDKMDKIIEELKELRKIVGDKELIEDFKIGGCGDNG